MEHDLGGYPKTGNPPRSFHDSWYFKAGKGEEKNDTNKRDWLVYSPRHDKMFCSWCSIFIPEGIRYYVSNWTRKGVQNWKKGLEKVREHKKSKLHSVAAFKYS